MDILTTILAELIRLLVSIPADLVGSTNNFINNALSTFVAGITNSICNQSTTATSFGDFSNILSAVSSVAWITLISLFVLSLGAIGISHFSATQTSATRYSNVAVSAVIAGVIVLAAAGLVTQIGSIVQNAAGLSTASTCSTGSNNTVGGFITGLGQLLAFVMVVLGVTVVVWRRFAGKENSNFTHVLFGVLLYGFMSAGLVGWIVSIIDPAGGSGAMSSISNILTHQIVSTANKIQNTIPQVNTSVGSLFSLVFHSFDPREFPARVNMILLFLVTLVWTLLFLVMMIIYFILLFVSELSLSLSFIIGALIAAWDIFPSAHKWTHMLIRIVLFSIFGRLIILFLMWIALVGYSIGITSEPSHNYLPATGSVSANIVALDYSSAAGYSFPVSQCANLRSSLSSVYECRAPIIGCLRAIDAGASSTTGRTRANTHESIMSPHMFAIAVNDHIDRELKAFGNPSSLSAKDQHVSETQLLPLDDYPRFVRDVVLSWFVTWYIHDRPNPSNDGDPQIAYFDTLYKTCQDQANSTPDLITDMASTAIVYHIAKAESNFNPYAKGSPVAAGNGTERATGLYQFLPSTWNGLLKAAGNKSFEAKYALASDGSNITQVPVWLQDVMFAINMAQPNTSGYGFFNFSQWDTAKNTVCISQSSQAFRGECVGPSLASLPPIGALQQTPDIAQLVENVGNSSSDFWDQMKQLNGMRMLDWLIMLTIAIMCVVGAFKLSAAVFRGARHFLGNTLPESSTHTMDRARGIKESMDKMDPQTESNLAEQHKSNAMNNLDKTKLSERLAAYKVASKDNLRSAGKAALHTIHPRSIASGVGSSHAVKAIKHGAMGAGTLGMAGALYAAHKASEHKKQLERLNALKSTTGISDKRVLQKMDQEWRKAGVADPQLLKSLTTATHPDPDTGEPIPIDPHYFAEMVQAGAPPENVPELGKVGVSDAHVYHALKEFGVTSPELAKTWLDLAQFCDELVKSGNVSQEGLDKLGIPKTITSVGTFAARQEAYIRSLGQAFGLNRLSNVRGVDPEKVKAFLRENLVAKTKQ